MTRYALPLLGVLILSPLPAGAAADKAAPSAQPQPDQSAGTRPGGAPPPHAEGKPGAQPPSHDPAAKAKGKAAALPKDEPPAPPSPQPPVDPATARATTEAATGYLNALKAKGFVAAPAWLHPSALARFKALVLPRLKDEQTRGTRTLLNATFGRDASYTSASAADPSEFMARFARLINAREPDAAPRFSALAPIGVLRDGEQVHVLMRLTQGSGPAAVERLEVVSLLPQDTNWKVALDGRLQALATTLASPGTAGPGGTLPRMEPLPEGLPPAPVPMPAPGPAAGPQGPAGLLPMPPAPPR